MRVMLVVALCLVFRSGPSPEHRVAVAEFGPTGRIPLATAIHPVRADSYPNEPPGFIPFAENDCSTVPDFPGSESSIKGAWYSYPKSSRNLQVTDDPLAPESPPHVLTARFPRGLRGGSGPVDWGGWDKAGFERGQKRKVYLSVWIKLDGSDFENHPTGSKLGFIAYGRARNHGRNEGFFSLLGTGNQVPARAFRLQFNQQGPVLRVVRPNRGRAIMTVGQWHHWEAVWELNTVGLADGTFRWWQDGVLIADYHDMRYLTPGNTEGFNLYKFNPTWGGQNGPVKRRGDSVSIDHVYLSGVDI